MLEKNWLKRSKIPARVKDKQRFGRIIGAFDDVALLCEQPVYFIK